MLFAGLFVGFASCRNALQACVLDAALCGRGPPKIMTVAIAPKIPSAAIPAWQAERGMPRAHVGMAQLNAASAAAIEAISISFIVPSAAWKN